MLLDAILVFLFTTCNFFYLLQRAVDVLQAPVGGQGVDGRQELVNVLFLKVTFNYGEITFLMGNEPAWQ